MNSNMAFVTLAFMLFVAATAACYFLFPLKHRWIVLLVASYIFFWINSQWLVVVIFAATLITFLIGRWITAINEKSKKQLQERAEDLTPQRRKAIKAAAKKKSRAVLVLGIVLVLSFLLVLKYYNFFADVSNGLLKYLGVTLPYYSFLMPIGISFYTLQAIAYMTDVYRNKCTADTNLFKFMLFMSFFPQIVQGPIARHGQLAHQLYEGHRFDYERATFGAQLFLWGMMKKLIIADRIAVAVNTVFDNYQQYTGLMVFFAAACYGIQVYTDFSGGMDIARGAAQIMGIDLELNFRQPYSSRSIEEFWRRWHITLGAWMREYIFYPLSLSKGFGKLSKSARKVFGQFFGKRLPAFLAMFIVYFLVGIWHGPAWKYIAYGVWNGMFIVTGILLAETYDKTRAVLRIDDNAFGWRLFQMLRTFVIVSLGRFFPRAESLTVALRMFQNMTVDFFDLSFIVDGRLQDLGLDTANWILLAVAVVVLLVVDQMHERGVEIRKSIARQHVIFRWIVYYAAIMLVLIFGIYGPGYDSASFIYEQF